MYVYINHKTITLDKSRILNLSYYILLWSKNQGFENLNYNEKYIGHRHETFDLE
jgi:hypothetical protein